MISKSILAITFAASALVVASSNHVHGPSHKGKEEINVDQSSLVYTATVADGLVYTATIAAGFPVSSSSDWFWGSTASRASMAKGGVKPDGFWGHWCSGVVDQNQWLQVSFMQQHLVTAVTVLGGITSFKIFYTIDGITWVSHDSDRIYAGSNDYNQVVKVNFSNPFKAVAVRINPFSWNYPWPGQPMPQPICTMAEVYILVPDTN